MTRTLPAVALLLLSATPAFTETGPDADSYLRRVVAEHQIPAVSAAIAVDGEIHWRGSAGFASLEEKTPAVPGTVFRIASISKVLTATAAMKLSEEGSLDLDAPVQQYIPDYPRWSKGAIRVLDLLAHTSGIKHYKDDESRSFKHYASLRDASSVFEERKLAFKPGTRYRYTSYGFTLLGAVMEAATGQNFRSIMQEKVWAPGGMSSTDLETRPDLPRGMARLYADQNGKIVPDVANDLSLIYPGGGMVSTAEDLLEFVIAFEGGDLMSDTSRQRMLEPPIYKGKVLDEHAGLGWNIWTHDTHGQVYHRVGGQAGASALLISYRDAGVAVALLTNKARLDPIWEITNHLIGIGLEAKRQ